MLVLVLVLLLFLPLTFIVFDYVTWNWFGKKDRWLSEMNLGSKVLPFKRSLCLGLYFLPAVALVFLQLPSSSVAGVSEAPQQGVKHLHLCLIFRLITIMTRYCISLFIFHVEQNKKNLHWEKLDGGSLIMRRDRVVG